MRLALLLRSSKYFKGFITVYKILKDGFVRYGVAEKKVLVHEDAVELRKFDSITNNKQILRKILKFPLNKTIIIYSGSLGEGKGIKTILDSSKILNNGDIIFIIIGGRTDEIKYWKKYVHQNNIMANVKFISFRENREIPIYLKSADILLAPYSLNSRIIKWISPIKLFEYMASKVPIIASDVKRLREICNNNECLFFKVDDAKDLSIKINKLIENKELQEILVQNAYKKVKNYTYKKRCKEILNKFLDI